MKTLVVSWMALGLAGTAVSVHAGVFAEMLIGASAVMERHAERSRPSQAVAAPVGPVAASAGSSALPMPPAQVSSTAASACLQDIAGDSCSPVAEKKAD